MLKPFMILQKRAIECGTLSVLRMMLGDEWVYDNAQDLSSKELSYWAKHHKSQVEGVIKSFQESDIK